MQCKMFPIANLNFWINLISGRTKWFIFRRWEMLQQPMCCASDPVKCGQWRRWSNMWIWWSKFIFYPTYFHLHFWCQRAGAFNSRQAPRNHRIVVCKHIYRQIERGEPQSTLGHLGGKRKPHKTMYIMYFLVSHDCYLAIGHSVLTKPLFLFQNKAHYLYFLDH